MSRIMHAEIIQTIDPEYIAEVLQNAETPEDIAWAYLDTMVDGKPDPRGPGYLFQSVSNEQITDVSAVRNADGSITATYHADMTGIRASSDDETDIWNENATHIYLCDGGYDSFWVEMEYY